MRNLLTKLKNLLIVSGTVFSLVFLIWGSFSWAKYTQSFDRVNLIIAGNTIISSDEYATLLNDSLIADLLVADIGEIANIIESHPYVSAARVSQQFPRGVLVEVAERKPLAIINGNTLSLIDKNMIVLPERDNSFDFDIPIFSNFEKTSEFFPVGQETLSPNARNAVDLLVRVQTDYPHLYENISEVRINKHNEFELILENEPTRIVIGREIAWTKILVLMEFENSLNGLKNLSDYSYLDLRYENQVITKERQV